LTDTKFNIAEWGKEFVAYLNGLGDFGTWAAQPLDNRSPDYWFRLGRSDGAGFEIKWDSRRRENKLIAFPGYPEDDRGRSHPYITHEKAEPVKVSADREPVSAFRDLAKRFVGPYLESYARAVAGRDEANAGYAAEVEVAAKIASRLGAAVSQGRDKEVYVDTFVGPDRPGMLRRTEISVRVNTPESLTVRLTSVDPLLATLIADTVAKFYAGDAAAAAGEGEPDDGPNPPAAA
jgi:hypothetical protein